MPQQFYARDALDVARDLLGKRLCRGAVRLRITEVEAYRWPGDTANHCRAGRTRRNEPMWGPAGCAYVYLCYGMHWMLNLVTGDTGEGAAVLIRSAEIESGLAIVRRRRAGLQGPPLCAGPGRLAAALGLDARFNHHPLHVHGGLEVCEGEPPAAILEGPRVGIDFASPGDRKAPWRLAEASSKWVTHRSRFQG